jgi:hypothetical protein
MTEKIESTLETEYTVEFSQPEKALAYFKGHFSRYFHDCEDLESASKYIAKTLQRVGESPCSVEGVGVFKVFPETPFADFCKFENLDNDVIGKIRVSFDFDND